MKIGALARSLGVPIPTVRRWTQEFAEGLSPPAQGGDGRPREFSTRDLRVLRRARELLADRDVTYAQARQRLRDEGLLASAAPAQAEPPSEPGPVSAEERDAAERYVASIIERVTLPWVERIDHLEREVARLRQQLAEARLMLEPPEEATNPGRRRWPFG